MSLILERQPPLRPVSPRDYEQGPLAPYLASASVLDMGADAGAVPDESRDTVFAGYRLQDIADYRAALQRWFRAVRVGGHLVVVVPHAFLHERQVALPSRWNPLQRRLYTPRSLMEEVEEALLPNSYRLRWLADLDAGYDYGLDRATPPVGRHDVALVLERIAPPSWGLLQQRLGTDDAPDFGFEPGHSRLEIASAVPREKILILKLDHLGDFIMGIPALEKARTTFPDAEITLVVGSWNEAMARDLAVADHVLAFDIYPRNSSEEEPDVRGKTALFDAVVTQSYDIAIDLRTDPDTRFLLRNVRARIKAGMGTKAEFDHLDIFLPIDITRHGQESATEETINHHAFSSQRFCTRSEFRISCGRDEVRHGDAIIWGPYRRLKPGRYIFEPFIEVDAEQPGILSCDVALDAEWQTFRTLPSEGPVQLAFTVDKPDMRFEARLWAVDGEAPLGFCFYGGRLLRQGASSVLHQSEYLSLLIELIAMRVADYGVLHDARGQP